jgi:nucleotide-binding universal stress UspA family protein
MKILVATDGTVQGRAAVEMASDIAALDADAHVEVLSVYEAPAMTAAAPYIGAPVWYPEMVEGAKTKAKGAAAAALMAVEAECPAADVDSVVCMGGPAAAIVQTAEDWGADLIVVGSHGYGFWGRAFYGSVSDQVVHHAPCSVLVVREGPSKGKGSDGA